MSRMSDIATEYRELILRVGPGFHVDTEDYTSLPNGVTYAYIQDVLDRVVEVGIDPYDFAYDVIHESARRMHSKLSSVSHAKGRMYS